MTHTRKSRSSGKRKPVWQKATPLFNRMWEECPSCKSKRVRYSAFLLKHLARLVTGSRTRYCAACGQKWYSKMGKTSSTMKKRIRVAILLSFVVLLMLVLWLLCGQKTATELDEEAGPYVSNASPDDADVPVST